ncbi:MAG: helix-turn-helix domain-containing protein [Olivibacter sp.]|jgi:transcriptional regulator GlxA family with amidase domain|uniref:GlxA family transcriptional regulator n=1 Tax=Olivibacter sp. 47 TaxID=3056486 RepID=UPI0025A4292B|nr:helix-turn-helix domain-containing protein [Olivibacter sp. 47]MCL4639257.1 helix-turn-helix domain-containing protein [Olivibacter sp. UJ_SKK_5.1]MDM8175421.1 helix-turn-helix domain-containing protein [Olivibacter sp. 47]
MKHISLLNPIGETSLSSMEATYKMFSKINEALQSTGKEALFDIQIVGLSDEVVSSGRIFSIRSDTTIHQLKKTDLIVIPAIHGNMKDIVAVNREFVPWIQKQYQLGAEIASLCVGAFLLASTGLLNGRSCTTHWLSANEFSSMFPHVKLMPYKVITDERGIYTSGGAYSSLNLILYLVEKFAGREMAIRSSKMFEIDIERNNQSQFIIFQRQKDHEDLTVRRAQELIEENFRERITVEDLADKLATGRRNFERRFKKATGNTILEYIQRVRIEAAKLSFETSNENVNEVMYNVGYSDSKSFRTTFKRITGLSPTQYKSKYNRQIAV